MALPGLVLVHGGAHAGDSWDLTVAELATQVAGRNPGRPLPILGGLLAVTPPEARRFNIH
jgi:hypothetical protein